MVVEALTGVAYDLFERDELQQTLADVLERSGHKVVHNVLEERERVEDLVARCGRFAVLLGRGGGRAFVDNEAHAVVGGEDRELGVGRGRDAAVQNEPNSLLTALANLEMREKKKSKPGSTVQLSRRTRGLLWVWSGRRTS